MLLACLGVTNACLAAADSAAGRDEWRGAYLGQTLPGDEPVLFAPDFLSTDLCERDLTFSADGREIYFTLQGGASFAAWTSVIVVTRQSPDGRWEALTVAPFSGRYRDLEPHVAPDGKRLYFSSDRPHEAGAGPRGDFDIWYVERNAEGWGEPRDAGATINSEHDEFYPTLTRDGTLYVTAAYDGAEAIWRAQPEGEGFGKPEKLGAAINAEEGGYNAFVTPDESCLLFGRGRDLHVSFRRADGSWTMAKNLGEAVNWRGLDYCPSLSADGTLLFFTSTRPPDRDYARTPPGFDGLLEHVEPAARRRQLRTRLFPYEDLYWMRSDILNALREEALAKPR